MNNKFLSLSLNQKSYDNDVILSDINIDFNSSGIYILKGENGSGKTTILNILSGLDLNFQGELIYLNEVINQRNIDFYNSKISYFTQQNILFDGLSVIDNLLLPFDNKDIKKAKSILQQVQLEGFEDKIVDTLSLGEKQRLCFCRILYSEKNIILLDESTENLDIENKTIILKALDSLKKDHLIIFATHDDFVINYFKEKAIITIENKSAYYINKEKISFVSSNNEHVYKFNKFKIKFHKPYFIFTVLFSFIFTFIFLVFSSFYTSINKEDISKKTYEIYLNTSNAYILNNNVDLSNNKYEKNTVFNIVNESKIEVNLEKNEYITSILTNNDLSFLDVLEGRLPENEDEIIISNYSFSNYNEEKIINKNLDNLITSSNIDKNYKIVGIYEGKINTYYQEKAKLKLNTHNYYEISYTFNYLSAFTLNDNSAKYGQILGKTSDNLKIITQNDIYDFSNFIRNKSLPCVPFFLDENGDYPFTYFDYTYGNLIFSIFSIVLLIIYMFIIVINYLINFTKNYLLLRAIGLRREKIEKTAIFDLIIPSIIGILLASIFSIITLLLINVIYNNIIKTSLNLLILINYFYLISLAIMLTYIGITIFIIKNKLSSKDLSKLISEIKIK